LQLHLFLHIFVQHLFAVVDVQLEVVCGGRPVHFVCFRLLDRWHPLQCRSICASLDRVQGFLELHGFQSLKRRRFGDGPG
jgi:hypothetical protein